MSDPIYVIPDIHGHRDKLEQALGLIQQDGGADAPMIALGDLVDRGPDSRGVIQLLMDGQAAGRNWTVLRGNHDQLFLDYLETGQLHSPLVRSGKSWLDEVMGGMQTLASYELGPGDSTDPVPQAHRDFLAGLPLYYETTDHILVHAGIRPGIPMSRQSHADLIWIRDPFLKDPRDHGKLVIHGHTSVKRPEHHGNRVNLDGGAGWGRPLHVAVIEGRQVWLLGERGRTVLSPKNAA